MINDNSKDADTNGVADESYTEPEAVKVNVDISDEQYATENTSGEGGSDPLTTSANKMKNSLEQFGGTMVAMAICSLMVLVAGVVKCDQIDDGHPTDDKCTGKEAFAIIVGIAGLVISIGHLFAKKRDMVTPRIRLIVTVVNFILWVVGAGILTFSAPFKQPGNGYFGTWAGLVFSFMMLSEELEQVQAFINKFKSLGFELGLLFIASIVVLLAAIDPCDTGGCSGVELFAFIVGGVSFLCCIILVFISSRETMNEAFLKIFLSGLTLWWVVGVFVLTFVDPFQEVENGYFACYAGLISSMLLLKPHL